jgi:hypothetical protein
MQKLLNRLPAPLLAALFFLPCQAAVAAHGAVSLPPSAQLDYSVKARQSGIALSGRSRILWQADGNRYLVAGETSAMLVGKILDERSEGAIDAKGLAPDAYTEKRFRKEATSTKFDRASSTIRFGESQATQKLQGGEQDRASALWQLIGVLRAEKRGIKPGMTWKFTVAGQKDADPWIFKVQARERLKTSIGELDTVHISRLPPDHAQERRVDIWLAPAQEWYPVRTRFEDNNDEFVEQFIEVIKRQ